MSMKPVLHSFAYGLDFLREQVADINEADMVILLGRSGITAATHLLARTIGVPKWLPTEWVQNYRTGSHPVTDPSIYDSKLLMIIRFSCRISDHPGTVVLCTRIGGSGVVDMLSGEQLSRIC